jgi:hypothetical protein
MLLVLVRGKALRRLPELWLGITLGLTRERVGALNDERLEMPREPPPLLLRPPAWAGMVMAIDTVQTTIKDVMDRIMVELPFSAKLVCVLLSP